MAASSAHSPACHENQEALGSCHGWSGIAVSIHHCARDPPPAPAGLGSIPLPPGVTQVFPLKQHQKGGYCSPASPRDQGTSVTLAENAKGASKPTQRAGLRSAAVRWEAEHPRVCTAG